MFQSLRNAFNARLSSRFLVLIVAVLSVVFVLVYLYSVPLIRQKVFEIERNSSRLALNNVFEVASRMHAGVEQYREQALQSHEEKLRLVVNMAETFLATELRLAATRAATADSAIAATMESLREFKYGNNDYIFVADYAGRLLSHPDDRFHRQRPDGNNVVPGADTHPVDTLVELARAQGEATYSYLWQRLDGERPIEKVSYVRDFPQWQLVIGTGVYMDDIEKEVQARTEAALRELRQALAGIRIAETGYMYVFDSQRQMLIHPNSNLDGTRFGDLLNPVSGQPIGEELMKLADTGRELHYLWDRPEDPGNYIYPKISLVRYMPGFDWYICSSVYIDELQSSANTLSSRLLSLASVTLFLALLISAAFINRLTRPLESLARTAKRIRAGDLDARSNIHRGDEVGTLAASFDNMVGRLKESIDVLDYKVRARTRELMDTTVKAQRMNAVGQLSGGMAHDFNNLLTVINGSLILAEQHYDAAPGLRDTLAPAHRATRRGADLIERLLSFSRQQPLQPRVTDVGKAVGETVLFLRGILGQSIAVEYSKPDTALLASLDPATFENALVNLAINARDAMDGRGTLYLTLDVQAYDGPACFDESVTPGEYIVLSVADTGSGFAPSTLSQAMEPFFTTKTNTQHSGLGLSMVYGFMKQSGGYIRLQNNTGSGATITLLLPRISAAPSALPAPSTGAPQAMSETLNGKLYLLVDDDDDVRLVVRQQLAALGIHVIEAADGIEASELIDTLPNIDGLLSDIVMPGEIDGYALAARMRSRFPDATVVLMTGYAGRHGRDSASAVNNGPLLKKPFDSATLAETLAQAAKRTTHYD